MEKIFEKIMLVNKKAEGKEYHPFFINHVREVCYGRCWDEATIEEYEIGVHVEGETTLCVDEYVFHPTKGTVFTFKPGEVHKQFVTSETPYERYILWFRYADLVALFDGAEDAMLHMFTDRGWFEKNVFQLPPHETQRLLTLLEKTADYSTSTQPEAPALFVASFLKALTIISNGYLHAEQKQESGNYSPIVSMALDIVEKQFAELQSVEELSAQLHISNSYLARIFKKQVGASVYEYIQNMKLSNAVKLLAAGRTVTEACFDSGFNNYSYFIQLFKRKYGITPRKYQKSLEL